MKTNSLRFAAKALWQMRAKGRPFVLSHGVTSRCNLRCSFCDYWHGGGAGMTGEMTTPEIKVMLDEAKRFGIGVYNAWTVEPLLRRDLPDIFRYAKGLGLMTAMVTNGLILKERARDLRDLDYLTVSLDGIKCYEEIRGADLDHVIEGIEEAKALGQNILINCVIGGKNIHELSDLVRLATDLGIWISFEPIHEIEGIDKEVWEDMGIRDLPSYQRAVDGLIQLKGDGAPIINSKTYLRMIRSLKPTFRCHATDIVLHVSSDGSIEGCRGRRPRLGHVSEGLDAVWRRSKAERKRIVKECKGCLFFGYVENSMLYDLVPEVMAHYEGM